MEIVIKTLIIVCIILGANNIITRTFDSEKLSSMIHIKFIMNMLKAVVWIIGITSIAYQFNGFNKIANTILAGSGIIAAILGLAAQESFANIFSGLFISIFQPFNIGDRIKIVGDTTAGYVEDITLRHTVIRTYTNVRIIIPNSIIGSSKIENSTYSKGASHILDVYIDYESVDKKYRALEIMEDVVTNHRLFYDTRTLEQKLNNEKPVTATCANIDKNGIHLRILVWTEHIGDNNLVCSECRLKILDKFKEENIKIHINKVNVIE